MEIIPVLDIMGGKAVAGRSGRRQEYRDLKTVFADSSDPLVIAEALPHPRLYVADLDGIMKGKPDYSLLEKLGRVKKLMVDVGVRDYEDYRRMKTLGVEVIIGTETLRDSRAIKRMAEGIVSIDLRDGNVLSQQRRFESPGEAFDYFRGYGFSRFIFLDISAVGTLTGNRFDFLKGIDFGGAEIMAGGGIVAGDIPVLENMGIHGVLVGTALHKGLL